MILAIAIISGILFLINTLSSWYNGEVINMLITRKSQQSGIERTIDIPVTQEQLEAFEGGMLIQRAMPNLTPNQREFILTGITQEEWDEMFPEDDDYIDEIEPEIGDPF